MPVVLPDVYYPVQKSFIAVRLLISTISPRDDLDILLHLQTIKFEYFDQPWIKSKEKYLPMKFYGAAKELTWTTFELTAACTSLYIHTTNSNCLGPHCCDIIKNIIIKKRHSLHWFKSEDIHFAIADFQCTAIHLTWTVLLRFEAFHALFLQAIV